MRLIYRFCRETGLLTAGLLLLFLAGDQPCFATVVATVNGDSITTSMMEEQLARIHMMQAGTIQRSDFSLNRLLQRLINDRLLVQEAAAVGLDEDSLVVDAVRRYRENLAYKALVRESLPDSVPVTEAETRAEFDRLFGRVDLRYLCVNDSSLAAALADSIRQGVPMDRLARSYSIDRYKDQGGLSAGQILGDLPDDLRPELASGAPGTVVGPNYLWRVWATLRVEAHHPADSALYDSVKTQVRELAMRRKRDDVRREFMENLQQSMSITVDTIQVDSILIRMAMGVDETDLPVATVAGHRVLTALTLRNKYVHKMAGRIDREAPAVLREALREQLDVMILQEAAARREMTERPEFDERVNAFRDSMLISEYLADVLAPAAEISDSEVTAYYEQNTNSFLTPAQYRVATLTRATQDDIDSDYKDLISGTNFSWLVRRHSIDDRKETDGQRDWASAGTFPGSILAQLDSLPIGGYVRPAKVEEGFVILRLLDRKPGEPMPIKDVSARIKSILTERKQLELIDETVKALRADADVEIFDRVLDELRISGPSEEEAGDQP